MDKAVELGKLQEQEILLKQWFNHPVTHKILSDAASQQESLTRLILEHPVINIETFLSREQALGHLRGLRRARAIVQGELDEVEQQIKELI